MRQAHRFSGKGQPYEGLTTIRKGKVDWTGVARFVPEQLGAPLKWRKPQRIFVNSMSDLFHPSLSNEDIAAVFGVMAACPQHTFQVLTKQPKRAAEWFEWAASQACHGNTIPEAMRSAAIDAGRFRAADGSMPKGPGRLLLGFDTGAWPLPNVHLGVSAENQEAWNARLYFVHTCPAAVHFASFEPLLGPIKLRGTGAVHLDWAIVGGESGPGARPCDVAWIESIVEQCRENAIACFVKQLGAKPFDSRESDRTTDEPHPEGPAADPSCALDLCDRAGGDPSEWPEALRVRQFPRAAK
jgi:protein gp37